MVIDGTRALIRGDYFTPKRGPYAGRVGPWTRLVRLVGIDPRSTLMKWIFVGYGLAWLVVAAAYVAGAPWGWEAMLVAAFGSMYYLVIGTITSILVVVLLLMAGPA